MTSAAARPELLIHTFGTPDVQVGGVAAEWHAASAQELLYYLLSFPEGRGKAEILDDLWGLDLDAASANRFRVTLHRLRAALGWNEAVREDHGRYRLAPEVFAASDVAALHAELHRAERATDDLDRLRAYQRALTLYAGDYLPQVQADWASRAREEHHAAYVRACIELSMLYCDHTDCAGAVGALARGLRADPYVGENHHQKLMTCLSVVEGKYAATEHYRRFLKFLHDDLNDTPMPETCALAERIKAGEPICRRQQGPDLPLTHNCPFTADGRCPGGRPTLN